jgi:2-phospho-L-lactate transferase/gluconeogenesis factor (CofD/UPF0052 family)
MEKNWEKVLVLGGEGGSVTLYGLRTEDGRWTFMKETNESALVDLFDDEDLSSISITRSNEVYEWSDALGLLGRHWSRLVPRYIHSDFKKLIWEEVNQLEKDYRLRRWEKACSKDKYY